MAGGGCARDSPPFSRRLSSVSSRRAEAEPLSAAAAAAAAAAQCTRTVVMCTSTIRDSRTRHSYSPLDESSSVNTTDEEYISRELIIITSSVSAFTLLLSFHLINRSLSGANYSPRRFNSIRPTSALVFSESLNEKIPMLIFSTRSIGTKYMRAQEGRKKKRNAIRPFPRLSFPSSPSAVVRSHRWTRTLLTCRCNCKVLEFLSSPPPL